jgi:hypothetical protein
VESLAGMQPPKQQPGESLEDYERRVAEFQNNINLIYLEKIHLGLLQVQTILIILYMLLTVEELDIY